MAIKTLDSAPESTPSKLTFEAGSGDRIQLPSEGFVAHATMTRDGDDLVLHAPNGEVAVVKDYYSVEEAPLLQSPNGTTLTPELVNSFSTSSSQYAANDTSSDESPVGAAEEVKGAATVTRTDGSIETISIGTPIYQGDVIQTEADGAVNIRFMDETSMAVSQNARMSIDNYNFDAKTESGETDFSVLRGVFVFTSGLIGRDDPDDVHITTPVGSIGIRGTIIAGDINPAGQSSITVLEGAIVVTNSQSETTLSKQFETVHLTGFDTPMQEMGVLPAADINARFESVSYVVPTLFSTIEDNIKEESNPDDAPTDAPVETKSEEDSSDQETQQPDQEPVKADPATPQTDQPALLQDNHSEILDPSLPSSDALGLNTTGLRVAAGESHSATTTTTTSTDTASARNNTAAASHSTVAGHHDDAGATPPPSVLKPTDAATNTPTALTISLSSINFPHIMAAGTSIGVVGSNVTNAGDVTYKFSNGLTTSPNGHFTLVTDGSGNTTLQLGTAGASALALSLTPVTLDSITILAENSIDHRVATANFTPTAIDYAPALNLDNANSLGVTVVSDNIINHAGYSIAALGDVDGDGFDDIGFTNSSTTDNRIYTLYGGAGNVAGDGILADRSITMLQSMTRLESQSSGFSGGSETVIAGVGDFNGDGLRDYALGQSDATLLNPSLVPFVTGNVIIGSLNVVGNSTFTYTTGITGTALGYSVAGVGDFNNDGRSDVVVGAPSGDLPGTDAGRFMLIKGNMSWDDANAATGGTFATLMNGVAAQDEAGYSVTGVGDMNGDGWSDFAVSMPGYSGDSGLVKIFYGRQDGSLSMALSGADPIYGTIAGIRLGEEVRGLGDINGDGFSDMLIGSDVNYAKIAFGYNHDTDTDPTLRALDLRAFTNYTVTGGGAAGDFNGDGYDDFTIALADASGTRIYVVYGKDGFSGFNTLNYLKNPENAFEISYTGANSSNDLEISSVGDFNGDGYDDIAIGVPDANGAATGDGGLIIVHGRNNGDSADALIATGDNRAIVGTSSNDIMSDSGLVGVSMRGGAGDDTFKITSTDFQRIDGGGQTGGTGDILRFETANGNLDFSGVESERIQSIEVLQFGAANQTITLTVENLFNMMKSAHAGSLTIDSAFAGNLVIDSPGAVSGSLFDKIESALNQHGNGALYTSTTGDYSHFQIGGYNLYIDTADLNVSVT